MSKRIKALSAIWLAVIVTVAMIIATYHMFENSYMRYKDTPVTFVDKFVTSSCHKSSCRDRYIGIFKTTDGHVFDRPISAYMYRQMHLGEQFALNIRQFDIQQTTRDNLLWFFGPVFILALTIVSGFLTGSFIYDYFKPSQKAPFS